MYKVKAEKEIKEYNNLLEAKVNALHYFKQNNKLVEVLDENDEVIFSKDELSTELPPTEEQIDNAFDSIIRNELSKLFLTIDDYNSDIATLKAEEADEEMIKVLDTILDDLNLHVGLLQRLLNE